MTPEEYARMHQKAFRVAFDFLNQHFPPADSDEWWLKMADDCGKASVSCGENRLLMELLSGIANYLGKEFKRRNENGGTED